MASTWRRGSTAWALLALIPSVTIIVGAANAVAGAATVAPAQLTAEAGYGSRFIPGRPVPVRVHVRGERLIRGQLVVSSSNAQVSQPFEVAGGSAKQFEMVLPTGPESTPLQIKVALTEQGHRLASAVATVAAGADEEVVGLVPGLLVGQSPPGPAPLSVDAGTARFVALTEQDLALSPGSLGPLTVVGMGADDLSRLGSETRQGILAWTASGGRLLIDSPSGDSIAGLPAGWQPGTGQRAAAGLGEVVTTGGSMASGQWTGLIDPVRHPTGVPGANKFNGPVASVSSSLATAAGLTTPRLRWLVVFLIAYIAVVGPIGFLLLRRLGRAELLWIAIPVVALLFAGTSYAIGSSDRAAVHTVQSTVLHTGPDGGMALSYVGLMSRGEATTRIVSPTGWVMQRYIDPLLGSAPTGTPLSTNVVDSGVGGRLTLNSGQFAVIEAAGPARFSGQLAVTARNAGGGRAGGTVRNDTPFRLEHVSVLIGDTGTDIGSLAPGAEATWSTATGVNTNPGWSVEQQLWTNTAGMGGDRGFTAVGPGGPFPDGFPVESGPASVAMWQAAPDGLAPGSRDPGVAVAVGWTRDYSPDLTVVGHGRVTRGRTAVVGTAGLTEGAPATSGDVIMDRQMVRGDLRQVGPNMFADVGNSGQPSVVQWTTPRGINARPLSLTIPAGTGRVEVWSTRGWRVVSAGTAPSPEMSNSGPGFSVTPTVPSQALGPPVTIVPGATVGTVPVPGPLPPPMPVPTPQTSPGPVTQMALEPGDVHNGKVYVRVARSQPFDLNALTLTVAS